MAVAFRNRVKTKTGCSTCRVRRKKCDDRWPLCSTCERLELRCRWAQTGLPSDTIAEARQSSKQSGISIAVAIRSGKDEVYFTETAPISLLDHPSILRASPTSVLTDPQDKQSYQYIFERGGHVMRLLKKNLRPPNNIFKLGVSLIEAAPSLRNAHLAIGAAHVFRSRDSISYIAAKYYQRSLHYLRIELARTDVIQPSEMACTTAGALSLYELKLERDRHTWGPLKLTLELYIYMFTVSSTFYGRETLRDKSLDYVDTLLVLLDTGPRVLGPNVAGVPSYLISAVYKLSWIRQKDTRDDTESERVSKIIDELERYPVVDPFHLCGLGMKEEDLTDILYHSACSILAQKLRDRSVSAYSSTVAAYVRNALKGLSYGVHGDVPQVCIGWPLVIVGLAIQAAADLDAVRKPLSNLVEVCGLVGLSSALDFLATAWSGGPGSSSYLGLDALFSEELLRTVHI